MRANYLASPPLVVAYALLGTMNEDITTAPLGTGRDGKPVYLRDIWPTNEGNRRYRARQHRPRAVHPPLRRGVQAAPRSGRRSQVATGSDTYTWSDGSTYVKNPPYFEGITMEPTPVADIKGARVLALLGDNITTDHISPAGIIKKDTPGRRLPAASTRSSRRTSTATARAAATTKS